MDISSLRAALCAAAFIPISAHSATLGLEAALELAVARSQTVRSSEAARLSATEVARGAARLPDPTLSAGVENLPITGPDRLSTTRDSMTMKRIGINQEWLSREKRAARTAAAEAAVQRGAIQVRMAVSDTRLQTAMAYVDAFYAGEALRLTELMAHHAHEELDAAKARFAASTLGSQEVLALTGARGAADDESAQVRQEQSAALVLLERWVGVHVDALSSPVGPMPPSEEDFVAAHPVVLASMQAVEVARREAAVTAAERNPNWTWGVSYGQRAGYSDMLSFGVSIPIPLSREDRQDRDTAAKLALVDMAEADAAEALRAAAAQYRAWTSDSQRLQDRIARFRTGVVEPATQRIGVATAGYAANQTTLAVLFEARHAEIEAQRKLLSLQRELAKATLQLRLRPLEPGAAS